MPCCRPSREAEQISFFANNLWQFTYPDPLTAEHQVQLGLLEHPQPRRVLLLGGGVAGLGAEILKTRTVTHLTYVELDPYLVRLAQGLLPAVADLSRDPRVHLIYQDARRFLETTHRALRRHSHGPAGTQERPVEPLLYPGILPHRGPEARARRGFQLCPARGRDQSVAAPGRVSGHGLPHPGPGLCRRWWPSRGARCGSSPPPVRGVLVSDPEVLVRRLKARQLPLQYVREYYLFQDLSPWRRQYLNQVLGQPPPSVNTDLNPRCYFFDLVLSTVQEGLGVKDALLALQNLPPAVPWAALVLATVLAGAGAAPPPRSSAPCTRWW